VIYLIAISPVMNTPHSVTTWLQKAPPHVSYVLFFTYYSKISNALAQRNIYWLLFS